MRKDISELLEGLNSKDWSDLFAKVDEMAHNTIASREDVLYRYIGEIDCPEEMLSMFATDRDVRRAGGKANWFICSDGTFFTCGDATMEAIFEEGKNVDYIFPFEEERQSFYDSLSFEEKIAFRVKLQNISATEAKEIVYCEMDIPPYANTYIFSVDRTTVDSFDNSEKSEHFDIHIEADSEDEARGKLSEYGKFEIGDIIVTGTRYTAEESKNVSAIEIVFGSGKGTQYTISVKDIYINLIDVKSNR